MGKQAKVRQLRRHLRWRVAVGAASPTAAESAYRRARGRQGLVVIDEAQTFTAEQLAALDEPLERVQSLDARNFYVGMSVSGPPEAFGLPPDPSSGLCSAHQVAGAYDCSICYPPRATVTITAVDYDAGTITLSTAP